jgi:hypothetical protein
MLPSTQNRIAINLNFGELKHVLSWCEKNCTGQFQYMEDPNGDGFYNSWIFFFENERDYVAFMLWKK